MLAIRFAVNNVVNDINSRGDKGEGKEGSGYSKEVEWELVKEESGKNEGGVDRYIFEPLSWSCGFKEVIERVNHTSNARKSAPAVIIA